MKTLNVTYILWLRQLKRYFRSKARIIGSLGQPLLFLIALGFGFGPIYEKAGDGSYIQFLVPGVIAMGVLFTAVFSGIEIIWDKQFGFLKETLVAPVSRFTIMLGRTLGGATVAVFQGVIILLLSFLFGFHPFSLMAIPLAILYMFLIAMIFTALGTAIASVLEDMQGFQLIMNFLVMPIFFFSGAIFPIAGLPRAIGIATSINPLAYGVDALRFFLEGTTHYGILMDTGILVFVMLLFLGVGAFMFSRIQV